MKATPLGMLGKLPSELRDMIYEFVLVNDDVLDIRNDLYKRYRSFSTPSLTTNPLLNVIEPGITHSSKKIREETLSIYYSQDFISRVCSESDILRLVKYIDNKPISFLREVKHLTVFMQEPWVRLLLPNLGPLRELVQALVNAGFTEERLRWVVGTQFPLGLFEATVQQHLTTVLSSMFESTQKNVAPQLLDGTSN